MRRLHGALAILVGLIMAGALVSPAGAASKRIGPEFFGVQDDHALPDDSGAWGSARVWGAWCTVQPSADVPVSEAAVSRLGPAFETYAASGARRLTVSLGHPSPWVFDDHPAATSLGTYVWYCEAAAANTSFPKASSLRSGPVRDLYVAYVRAVIRAAEPYLAADPDNRLVLQTWNEPNLRNGGTIRPRIPGAARTWKQASNSLRRQERILRYHASRMIPGRFEITSPSLYGKETKLGNAYFKAQAKRRTVDSFSLNFYTLRQSSVNKSLAQWQRKARRAKRQATQYRKLRTVPLWLTETNHNLVNGIPSTTNVDGVWALPETQVRLVEVSTMEALRRGFAGIQWYQGSLTQTAVNTRPGTPATLASATLRDELVGRRLLGCSKKRTVTRCRLSARPGDGRIVVTWSSTGTSGVRIKR